MARPIKVISEDEYREMDDNYQGICLACGEIADECEPDARKYECQACGAKKVYGIEEALNSGYIDIADDSDDDNGEYESDEESDEDNSDAN